MRLVGMPINTRLDGNIVSWFNVKQPLTSGPVIMLPSYCSQCWWGSIILSLTSPTLHSELECLMYSAYHCAVDVASCKLSHYQSKGTRHGVLTNSTEGPFLLATDMPACGDLVVQCSLRLIPQCCTFLLWYLSLVSLVTWHKHARPPMAPWRNTTC